MTTGVFLLFTGERADGYTGCKTVAQMKVVKYRKE